MHLLTVGGSSPPAWECSPEHVTRRGCPGPASAAAPQCSSSHAPPDASPARLVRGGPPPLTGQGTPLPPGARGPPLPSRARGPPSPSRDRAWLVQGRLRGVGERTGVWWPLGRQSSFRPGLLRVCAPSWGPAVPRWRPVCSPLTAQSSFKTVNSSSTEATYELTRE